MTAPALFAPAGLTSFDFVTAAALFVTAAALFVPAGPHLAAAALLVPGGPLRKRKHARALMHQCKVHREVLVYEA